MRPVRAARLPLHARATGERRATTGRGLRVIAQLVAVVTGCVWVPACQGTPHPTPVQTPILESVVSTLPQRPVTTSVVPQNSDGTYPVLGLVLGGGDVSDVALRVQTDGTVLTVSIDGQPLAETRPADADEGWFSNTVRLLSFASLPWFAELHVHLPPGKRPSTVPA
jgi:hypothetical protein